MSRTNPYKKKMRQAKNTLLIFGEGMAEEVFLKYLREIYSKDSGIAVTIRKGDGSTANRIVMRATRVPGNFEKRIVVLDNDKAKTEMEEARKIAKKNHILLIENKPCLEATLLSILDENKNFKTKPSKWCKSEFESKYIARKKRSEKLEYKKLFPKKLLGKAKERVLLLKQIIQFLTGK